MESGIRKAPAILFLVPATTVCQATPASAQHGDYILGTAGLLAAQQPPEGLAYQNLWSYYTVSGSEFRETGPIKCGPLGRLCLSANFKASGSLDLFVDQNIFWLVTPFKVPFINATYAALLDVPFVLADASGAGALEPILTFNGFRNSRTVSGGTASTSSGVTKGGIGDGRLGGAFRRMDERRQQSHQRQAHAASVVSSQQAEYQRAMAACLEGRGYSVK